MREHRARRRAATPPRRHAATTVFTGEAYNAEVAAKTSTSFGYCLNY